MKVAFTGHRPNKIFGYDTSVAAYQPLRSRIDFALQKLAPTMVLSGMALGVDQIAAEECIRLGIPFTACVPFVGQEGNWPTASQEAYRRLIAQAHSTIIVSPGGYSAAAMQVRNRHMVDHSDVLIAVWDGSEGGTDNCVSYARSVGRRIVRIDPRRL